MDVVVVSIVPINALFIVQGFDAVDVLPKHLWGDEQEEHKFERTNAPHDTVVVVEVVAETVGTEQLCLGQKTNKWLVGLLVQ